MAIRRPPSACLFCQARQSLVGRRRLTTTTKRRLETAQVALRPEDDGFFLGGNKKVKAKSAVEDGGPVLPVDETIRQWKLESPVDELREALLGFDALWQRRDLRLQVLRSLSNPWPPSPKTHQQHGKWTSKTRLQLPEANAAPIPHEAFRRSVKTAFGDKAIRKVLREQLLRCAWPREVLRVIAVAMQNKVAAQNVAALAEPIIRALYRCRENVSDPEILSVLNTVIARFKMAGISPEPTLYILGLKFAARARSLACMKRYLQLIRETGSGMTSNNFRSVIAKCSIGHRGLGEIRNGRWRRDQLLQVLNGFDDAKHLPSEQQYHLGSFLDRDDWQFLHGFVAVLARCRDVDGVWREWETWKKSPARTRPKSLHRQDTNMTSKKRGDYWFVEQMTYAGDLKKAWHMVAEAGLPFNTIKDRVKMKLLDEVEHATVWDESVRDAMVWKYDMDLRKIEKALGVQWVAGDEDGEGGHELNGDQEETLEKLGSDDWKLEEDYGFPRGDEAVTFMESDERTLHDAEEKGLADGET